MRYAPINPRVFVENRARLKNLLLPNSLVVVNANDAIADFNDVPPLQGRQAKPADHIDGCRRIHARQELNERSFERRRPGNGHEEEAEGKEKIRNPKAEGRKKSGIRCLTSEYQQGEADDFDSECPTNEPPFGIRFLDQPDWKPRECEATK